MAVRLGRWLPARPRAPLARHRASEASQEPLRKVMLTNIHAMEKDLQALEHPISDSAKKTDPRRPKTFHGFDSDPLSRNHHNHYNLELLPSYLQWSPHTTNTRFNVPSTFVPPSAHRFVARSPPVPPADGGRSAAAAQLKLPPGRRKRAEGGDGDGWG
ncbi:unnamed protein product [Durusdinium trenchii]|uniref:Uncharacterized protein n=1 Tax=Durusdinium trenchii TaxID=1381693 RepID=A0ABP0N9U1_9DINO